LGLGGYFLISSINKVASTVTTPISDVTDDTQSILQGAVVNPLVAVGNGATNLINVVGGIPQDLSNWFTSASDDVKGWL
jgi:hypothetical protein